MAAMPPNVSNEVIMEAIRIKGDVKIADETIVTEDDLANLRLSLGIYIRDVFRLDAGNRDLLESCREISKDKYLHHSQAPAVIIKELWKRLRKTHKLRAVK